MSLAADVHAAAGTLQAVSAGLAAALRLAAGRPRASPAVVDTFRGAEALSLTVTAVLDEAEPLLALLADDASVVGANGAKLMAATTTATAATATAAAAPQKQLDEPHLSPTPPPLTQPLTQPAPHGPQHQAPSPPRTRVRQQHDNGDDDHDNDDHDDDDGGGAWCSSTPPPAVLSLASPDATTPPCPRQHHQMHRRQDDGHENALGAETPSSARIRNGYDSLGLILLSLLRKATDAVSDVAANQSQWLLSPLQAKQCFEAMSIHHAQLKAMYGIIHLTSKVIHLTDPSKTLFVDVTGPHPHPELEPVRWRAAIKMDAFYGRFFGFHYRPEMRNFLRVVNIARGSIKSAAATAPDVTSPFVRNIAALGWGWVYSHMVILNNLGVSIDSASQIGSDNDRAPATIDQVRSFMNLAEDPFVSGVSALASVDVAIDLVFDILPEPVDGVQLSTEPTSRLIPMTNPDLRSASLEEPKTLANAHMESQSTSSSKLHVPIAVPGCPIAARIISAKGRPINRDMLKRLGASPRVAARDAGLSHDVPDLDGTNISARSGTDHEVPDARMRSGGLATGTLTSSNAPALLTQPVGALGALGSMVKQFQERMHVRIDLDTSAPSASNAVDESGTFAPSVEEVLIPNSGRGNSKMVTRNRNTRPGSLEFADSSLLASAIKHEFVKFQSNVTSFLGQESVDIASHLVVYIHGGGFVSQSSGGHAVYLKEWAVDVPDSVILCIDYKLAPEYPYPTALDECVYAYKWALDNATTLGTRATRVVLCGDSAGGNLAVAVAMKANACGLRPADGICLAYPALYVNPAWSPSRLLSFFDPLLPLSILDLCVRAYVPNGYDGASDPFISPMVASDKQLQALPPVSIISGTLDPLMDDAVQFMHKLRLTGRTCDNLRLYESMPHGFLNMIQVCTDAREAMRYLGRNIAGYLQTPVRKGSRLSHENRHQPSTPPSPSLLFDS